VTCGVDQISGYVSNKGEDWFSWHEK